MLNIRRIDIIFPMEPTQKTTNYIKHTSKNPLQVFLINNFYNTAFSLIKKVNPKKILDVGCGEGESLAKIKALGLAKHLEGIDYSDEALKIGGKIHPNLKLRKASVYNLPYKDNSFDLIICTEVFEHLDNPRKALDSLYRVTSRYCLISVPNEPIFRISNFLRGKYVTRFGNSDGHINHWSKGQFVKFVKRRFNVVETKAPLPWTMVLAEKK